MQVAFWAEMASAQESALEWALETAVESAVLIGWAEVRLYLCVSSVPPDFMRCNFTKEDIRPFDFDEALLRVLLLQPSTCYAHETQHPGSSFLRLRCEVSLSDTEFPLLRRAKIRLWPFWPYSMPGACWTVRAVRDLLALP
jgi:hypothetical protein